MSTDSVDFTRRELYNNVQDENKKQCYLGQQSRVDLLFYPLGRITHIHPFAYAIDFWRGDEMQGLMDGWTESNFIKV